MADVEGKVVPGVTEIELASEVAYRMKLAGVAHGIVRYRRVVDGAGRRPGRNGPGVRDSAAYRNGGDSFDFGAVVEGYCSDFGRTVHIGEPDAEYLRVYELVMAAQQAGIDAVRPGVTAAEVHAATLSGDRGWPY